MIRIGHADVCLRDLKDIGCQEAVGPLRLKFEAALDLLAFRRFEWLTGEAHIGDRKERRRIANVRRKPDLAEIRETFAMGELVRRLLDARFCDPVVRRDVRRIVTPGERDHPSRADLHVVLKVEAEQRRRLPRVEVGEEIGDCGAIDRMIDVDRRPEGESADDRRP